MKYYDNQPARKGDKFIIGTFGTCHVEEIDEHAHVATVRNTQSGEVFELDSLKDADLITHVPITGEVYHFDPVSQCWVLMLDKGASARIAELEAALKDVLYGGPGEGYVSSSEPDSFESRCNRAEEILKATI